MNILKNFHEPRIKRASKYYFIKLFPRNQSIHKVSLSIALGVFVALLPTLGVALLLTLLLCKLLKLPSVPACLSSFVGTPPSLLLFFWPLSYQVGVLFIPANRGVMNIVDQIAVLKFSNFVMNLQQMWLSAQWALIAFSIGVVIVSAIFGVLSYAITFFFLKWKRKQAVKL